MIFFIRASYSSCMALNHSGEAITFLTMWGLGKCDVIVAWKTLGLEMLILEQVIIGWIFLLLV